MKHDDPKLTAYALGELDEAIELDERSAKTVEDTALIASVLRQHFRRPRRRLPKVRYALAASLLIAIAAMLVSLSRPSQHETIVVVPVAILFGGLILAGREIQPAGVPRLIQGIILFTLIASDVLLRYRIRLERVGAEA